MFTFTLGRFPKPVLVNTGSIEEHGDDLPDRLEHR